MYEIEYKTEITKGEKESLASKLSRYGFMPKKSVIQNDFYIEAKESPYGGYDLRRYRDEGHAIFYTEKAWEKVGAGKARRETERKVSRPEFEAELIKYPNTIAIRKGRQSFSGTYRTKDITIDIDTVKFDHSPAERYFIEAEVIGTDKEEAPKIKDFLRDFIAEVLQKSQIIESPGMFTMAFEKR
jgi:adenylate cyclase class IV